MVETLLKENKVREAIILNKKSKWKHFYYLKYK